jgi:hypothetical protein
MGSSHRKKRAFFPKSVPSGGLLSFKLRCSILLFFTRACVIGILHVIVPSGESKCADSLL